MGVGCQLFDGGIMTGKYLTLREVDLFAFRDPIQPCTYWSSGEHVVADGKCRCGREFWVSELVAGGSRDLEAGHRHVLAPKDM